MTSQHDNQNGDPDPAAPGDDPQNPPAAPGDDPQQQQGDPAPAPGDDPQPGAGDAADDDTDSDTFPREYVQRLRAEAKAYRQQLNDTTGRTGELETALWSAQVAAAGRLADPTDLPLPADVDPADPAAVNAAIDELLQRKPHLVARRAYGDIGQHASSSAADSFSLLGTMQANA